MSTVETTATPLGDEREIPPLAAGDRLSRAEFERRYSAMPNLKKAELIEGRVFMPSPVSTDHASPHFDLITWLGIYKSATPGTQGGDNATLRLDMDNEPQPDAFLRILPENGGQSRAVEGYVEGAPELVVEVAASSASYDLHDKLHVYRRNGVLEYLVWRVWDRAIDWFVLEEGEYQPLAAGEDGITRSRAFGGLWLDAPALLAGDSARVLAVVQEGIKSQAHAEFAQRIRSGAAK